MKAGQRIPAPVSTSIGADRRADRSRTAASILSHPEPSAASAPALPGWNFAALSILPHDDEREVAAERTARCLVRGQPAPGVPAGGGTAAVRLPSVQGGAGGAPLDADARLFFEPRLGWSFGGVRVHTDDAASRTADALGAVAATVGSDIAFARGRYEPGTARGRTLLAHELVHVVQQASGPRVVARKGVEQYETRGIPIDRAVLEDQAGHSYWDLKLRAAGFIPSMDLSTQVRLAMDGEELHAVMAVIFQTRPQGRIAQEVIKILRIPRRRAARTSQDVTYQVTFEAQPTEGRSVRLARIFFVGEGKAGAPITADAPSTSFQTTVGGYSVLGFPQNNDAAKYWQGHAEEQRRVFNWIENQAPRRFDQLLATPTASFHVKGEKDRSDKVSGLVITFLGAVAPSQQAAPADYLKHDFSDKAIEDVRATADPLLNDTLGAITGIGTVPEGERGAVKFAIGQYFRSQPSADASKQRTGTRNAEVDAVVPIQRFGGLPRGRKVLYTFRFTPNAKNARIQDVAVQRIGEEGVDAGVSVSLTPRGSLARVNGFADHAVGATEADKVKSLVEWLKIRYHGLTPAAAATVADLQKDVDGQMRAGSKSPTWFDDNYGIKILTKADAIEWMDKKLGMRATEDRKDIQDFESHELPLLEYVLERMSDGTLSRFREVRLIRQKVYFEFVTKGVFEMRERVAGVTHGGATTRTIRLFDAATDNPEALFLGGLGPDRKPMTMAGSALPFAHELGHVVSDPGVQKAFDRLVKDKGIKPLTWYAASNVPNELFPEAFALYYADPEWLQNNWPDLFNFFDALDKRPAVKPATKPKSTGRKTP